MERETGGERRKLLKYFVLLGRKASCLTIEMSTRTFALWVFGVALLLAALPATSAKMSSSIRFSHTTSEKEGSAAFEERASGDDTSEGTTSADKSEHAVVENELNVRSMRGRVRSECFGARGGGAAGGTLYSRLRAARPTLDLGRRQAAGGRRQAAGGLALHSLLFKTSAP